MSQQSAASSLAIAATPDTLMLAAVAGSVATAVAIGISYDQLATAPVVGVALLALGAGAVMSTRSSVASSLVLACCLMGLTVLDIQLGRGTLEFHFGVFATLAVLLVYRDW